MLVVLAPPRVTVTVESMRRIQGRRMPRIAVKSR